MKKLLSMMMLAGLLSIAAVAGAEEVKMVGTISKIEMAADGKSAVVTLKDTKSGDNVTVSVSDDLTLDKFNDKRIVEGDEIRCKYDNADGKNKSVMFKKTAGC